MCSSDLVVLEAQDMSSVFSSKPIVHGVLSINWPGGESFPWTEYYFSAKNEFINGPDVERAFLRFKRIALTFRSHSKGQLARFKDKIEHQRILKGKIGENLLSKLKEDGIIKSAAHMYVWDTDVADQKVGVSWHDLRKGTVNKMLAEYLIEFNSSLKD